MTTGTDTPELRLWVFMQSQTYSRRGGNFKYVLGNPQQSQAFPLYAARNDLGAPVAPNLPQPLLVDGRSYNFQPFARDTIFNEGQNWTAVQSMNSLLGDAIPAGGLGRELLAASYRAAQEASAAHGQLEGKRDLNPGWKFHVVAAQQRLGPALSGNYASADGQYYVQVFAGDTLYTPASEPAGCRRLSETGGGDPAFHVIWGEAYKVAATPYDPNSPFQQRAVEFRLGPPLSAVFGADFEGTAYQIQVFALDTLFAGPDGAIRRLKDLPKPADVVNWQPAQAPVYAAATAPSGRMTPEQIAALRAQIRQEADLTVKGNRYEELQAAVIYASQRDNQATINGARIEDKSGQMCNLTSLAMALSYLGIANPKPQHQYEDAIELVRQENRLAARTTSEGWGGVARALGARHIMIGQKVTAGHDWWEAHVRPALRSGCGVIMSIGGHIVRVQAVTPQGLIVDDPYGRCELLPGEQGAWKYSQVNEYGVAGQTVGEDVLWPWSQVSRHTMRWIARIEPFDGVLSPEDEEQPIVEDDGVVVPNA